MVRAAYGRPAISSSIYFLLADYLYQYPTTLVKIFIWLDIFVNVAHKSRGENINDGYFSPEVNMDCKRFLLKTLWIHNICFMRRVISEY